jgi:mono/diheme cytochrome c family protein
MTRPKRQALTRLRGPLAWSHALSRKLGGGLLLVVSAVALGCRGQPSSDPPRRLWQDMWDQPRLRPQSLVRLAGSPHAVTGLPPGVVAHDQLGEDQAYFHGIQRGRYLQRVPISVSAETLARGEERFNIHCSVCHDRAGSGRGVAPQRGFPTPTDLTSENTRGLADGEVFNIMSAGLRNMPAYSAQVPVADRWTIVVWIRVLQRSQNATLADVPEQLRSKLAPPEAGS